MPSSIKEVGFGAFYMCENLQYVELSDGLTTIGDQAFSETNIENITIPESVVTVGSNPFDTCLNLKEFKGKYAADSGRCLIVDGVLKSFAIGCGLTSYTTPAEAKTIGLYSFTGCQLTDIIVAPGTEKLEFRAFAFSESLSSITIPDSVINFSHAILSGCLNLKEINCFYSSEDKRCLTVNGVCIAFAGAGITEYTIPEYVGCLGQELFAGCRGLTYVVLPSTIAEIGFAAFYNCTNLKEVYSMSKVPPVMRVDGSGGYEFDGNAPDRVIYVPKESVVAYKEADRWYDYADSIVGYDNQLAAPELTIEDITDSSFTVAWQQVENADYYLVDDGSKKHEVYDNHFTVENISSGKYTIKVKSMAALGSPYVSSSFAQVEHVFGSLSDEQRQWLGSWEVKTSQVLQSSVVSVDGMDSLKLSVEEGEFVTTITIEPYTEYDWNAVLIYGLCASDSAIYPDNSAQVPALGRITSDNKLELYSGYTVDVNNGASCSWYGIADTEQYGIFNVGGEYAAYTLELNEGGDSAYTSSRYVGKLNDEAGSPFETISFIFMKYPGALFENPPMKYLAGDMTLTRVN